MQGDRKQFASAGINDNNLDTRRHATATIGMVGFRSLTIDVARSWMMSSLRHNGCRMHKRKSKTYNSRARLPTRLIKVKSLDNQTTFIQLIHERCLDKVHADYVALSHCCGGVVLLRLTKVTEASSFSDIPLTSLPKTFLEVIRVTVLLVLDYIWIDSLCIVQDGRKH
jgi:hypothetical protein